MARALPAERGWILIESGLPSNALIEVAVGCRLGVGVEELGRASVSPELVSAIAHGGEPRDGAMRGGNVGLAPVREDPAHSHSRVEEKIAGLAATLTQTSANTSWIRASSNTPRHNGRSDSHRRSAAFGRRCILAAAEVAPSSYQNDGCQLYLKLRTVASRTIVRRLWVGSSRSRGWELTFGATLAPRSVNCRIPAARSTQSSDRNGRRLDRRPTQPSDRFQISYPPFATADFSRPLRLFVAKVPTAANVVRLTAPASKQPLRSRNR